MTQRNSERVRGIVRSGNLRHPEQQLHHLLHLRLLRAAIPDDGPFDLRRGVLHELAAGFNGGKHRHAAGVTQLEGTAHVVGVKQVLHRDAFGTAGAQQLGQLAVNDGEPLGEGLVRRSGDGTAGHETRMATVRLHAPVTGASGARIDAENPHASDASISFSSMSKFAQTCCTSSWSSSPSMSRSICWASLPVSLM